MPKKVIKKSKIVKKSNKSLNKDVYLDNAATTPIDDKVLKMMIPYYTKYYGNPSSLHTPGQIALRAVTSARKSIADSLNAHLDEIIFTSGGTESDNLAIHGAVFAMKDYLRKKYDDKDISPHVITTSIEHPAVLEVLIMLQKRGRIDLSILPVQKNGIVKVDDVISNINERTALISVMYANNEVGTIQPIADIGRKLIKYRKQNNSIWPLLHSDACQAAGYLDLNVEKLHVDLMTINAGKIYGPKGIGLLYIRRGVRLHPRQVGGGQERGVRSGTENVPGIVGMAKALELVQEKREKESVRVEKLRDRLIEGLLKIPKTRLNGDAVKRLPNNVNISFMDIEGEAAMLYLDAKGIYCSTGSACASSSLDPSHVILALGMSYEAAHGSLRFTLGKDTTKADVDYVIKTLPPIVEQLRKISPVNLDMEYFVNEKN